LVGPTSDAAICGAEYGAKNLARLAAGSVLRATVDGIRDATSQWPSHAHRIAMIGLKIAPDLGGVDLWS
jgi:hypothetical protein